MRALGIVLLLSSVGCGSTYYEPCDLGVCPSGLFCADPGDNDVCTTTCADDVDCTSQHGEGSFCSLGGLCLSRCAEDADCPISAYCDTATDICVR